MTAPYTGRTLLVGLGGIGLGYDLLSASDTEARHLNGRTIRTHASAIDACAATTLIGGVDPSERCRLEFESALNAPAWPSIEAVPATDVDIVVLATPTVTHREVAAQVLASFSPRLLLCEKPVGTSAKDTLGILAMAESQGTALVVNYFRHYLPELRDVREQFRRGDFGEFTGGSLLYSHGLRRNGSHFVALLLWILGDAQIHRLADLSTQTEDPAFALSFGGAVVNFSSVGHGRVRVAEACLVFSRGVLRLANGGIAVSWAEVDEGVHVRPPAYSDLRWERCDDMQNCQFPVYEWLTSPDLAPSELAEGVRVAVRTQEIVDEVTRGI